MHPDLKYNYVSIFVIALVFQYKSFFVLLLRIHFKLSLKIFLKRTIVSKLIAF